MITGSSLFIYGSSQTSTINSNATLMFDAGMTFSYISSTNNKLAYTDSTGILYFNQATSYALQWDLR